MSQEDVASSVNITQKTQSAIETGKNSPSLVYLLQLAQLGFDVQFVVTGVQSKNLSEVSEVFKLNLQDSKQIAISLLEVAITLLREDS